MIYAVKPDQFKNWIEICKLDNPDMRIIISICQEPATLSLLAKMFPACFSNQRQKPKIPQSAIVALTKFQASEQGYNAAHQEHNAKFMWQKACNILGLQLERYCRPNASGADVCLAERAVFEQLHGKIPQPGMEVEWRKKRYIVVQIDIRPEDINKPIPKNWQPVNLMLLPAEQIDRNS